VTSISCSADLVHGSPPGFFSLTPIFRLSYSARRQILLSSQTHRPPCPHTIVRMGSPQPAFFAREELRSAVTQEDDHGKDAEQSIKARMGKTPGGSRKRTA